LTVFEEGATEEEVEMVGFKVEVEFEVEVEVEAA